MKLKLFSVLAGTTLGWILPPDNYTNPCEDFKGQFNSQLTYGHPEWPILALNFSLKWVKFELFKVSRASLFKGKTIRQVSKSIIDTN